MITLTVEEKKVLNNISQQRDPDVKLGDLLAAVVAPQAMLILIL